MRLSYPSSHTLYGRGAWQQATRLLLCRALLLLVVLSSPTAALPQYFYTLSTNVTVPPLPYAPSFLPLPDDAPLQQVALSFVFPFYQPTSYIYVNPNGALHMLSGTPPCCQYYTSSPYSEASCDFQTPPSLADYFNLTACTTETSVGYSDIVMPLLTDLDPVSGGTVAYVDTGSQMVIAWDEVPWWRYNSSFPLQRFSFAVELWADGSIVFYYVNVSNPAGQTEFTSLGAPTIERTLLVGLRGLPGLSNVTTNQAQYNSTLPGVYPPVAWVRDGNAITFCAVDTFMCLYPTAGSYGGNELLSLTSAYMTCASRFGHNYTVSFVMHRTPLVLTVPAHYDAGSNTLQLLSPGHGTSDTATVVVTDTTANLTVALASPLYYTFAPSSPFPRWTLLDMCKSCGYANPFVCTTDCSGTYFGSAQLDLCDHCTGGTTGLTPNAAIDCTGLCTGQAGSSTLDAVALSACLCPQLVYPPVVPSAAWLNSSGQGFGQFIGPVAYYEQQGWSAVSCGLSSTSAEVLTTLSPLDDYQLFVLAATSVLLLLASLQAVASALHRPLFHDPFHPTLFVLPAGRSRPAAASVSAAAPAAPSVVLVAEDVGRVEDGGVLFMSEAEVRRGAQVVRAERERNAPQLASGHTREQWRRRQARLVNGQAARRHDDAHEPDGSDGSIEVRVHPDDSKQPD